MTTAYWWVGDDRVGHVSNFGDVITPILLSHFAGIEVTWAPPELADIVCAGSVIDVLPRTGWHGIVAGAGQLHGTTLTDLTWATVLGIRGPLTRERIQIGNQNPVIGDPGLVLPELVTPTLNKYELGVVPHWSDKELFPKEYAKAQARNYALPILIDPIDDPLSVATKIGSCRKIITSSLHGTIVADGFGIPRRVEPFPSMLSDSVHEGAWFKWKDYGHSIGQPIVFGSRQVAPKLLVDRMQHDLFDMFQVLRNI